jgi:hypothetical protein
MIVIGKSDVNIKIDDHEIRKIFKQYFKNEFDYDTESYYIKDGNVCYTQCHYHMTDRIIVRVANEFDIIINRIVQEKKLYN